MGMQVGNKGGGPMADPNIVPFIDVLLVLLIIFMVITPLTPKGSRGTSASTGSRRPAKCRS